MKMTYRLTASLPLGSLLRRWVGLAPALVARLGYLAISVETLRSHWGLLAVLPDRISSFLIGGGLV